MTPKFNRYKLEDDKVTIYIPAKKMPDLKAVRLDIGDVPMDATKDFTPINVVANIAIIDKNRPGIFLSKLGGKIKIKVRYEEKDLEKVVNERFILAFWDGKDWVLLNKAKHKFYRFTYENHKRGGYGVIWIEEWSDPPMAWGT
jgi:hypothetical protein